MAINIPGDAAPKMSALAAELRRIARDRRVEYSDQDLRDAAINPLLLIVADWERARWPR